MHPVDWWWRYISTSGSSSLLHDAICWYTSLYLYTLPACFLMEVRPSGTLVFQTLLFTLLLVFFYARLNVRVWLSIRCRCLHTKLVLYRCSYISIRCCMYDATINLECNADRRVSVDLFSRRDGPGWRHAAPCCLKAQQQLERCRLSAEFILAAGWMKPHLQLFQLMNVKNLQTQHKLTSKLHKIFFQAQYWLLQAHIFIEMLWFSFLTHISCWSRAAFLQQNSCLSKNLEKLCIYELYS